MAEYLIINFIHQLLAIVYDYKKEHNTCTYYVVKNDS